MRSVLIPLLVFVAGSMTVAQEPTFRTGTQIVSVVTTVTDSQGRLVPGLEREAFTIYDNGEPQPITFFQNDVQPFTVVVMMDYSASMTANLDRLQAAAEQFIIRMLPEDRGQVGSFSDKIQFLWDAIDASIVMLEGIEGRRVVLGFTDGDDTASRVGRGDVLDRAQDQETMIYAIGLESEYFNGQRQVRTRPDRGLRGLAEETGGGYFELEETDDLGPTFSRVAQELHSQYTLGFTPTNLDGREHELEVTMNDRGMNARARTSYIASQERLRSAE